MFAWEAKPSGLPPDTVRPAAPQAIFSATTGNRIISPINGPLSYRLPKQTSLTLDDQVLNLNLVEGCRQEMHLKGPVFQP